MLDVGCGTGRSVEIFSGLAPAPLWIGVDVADSPEVRMRTRTDVEFHTFDGVNLPFDDDSFDVVYCAQVLEHVRHPESLLHRRGPCAAPGRLAGRRRPPSSSRFTRAAPSTSAPTG